MLLTGPDWYRLVPGKGKRWSVLAAEGKTTFRPPASRKGLLKLYVVVLDQQIQYVGMTSQAMSTRLRMGFTATGKHGYHGYAWRSGLQPVELGVWSAPKDDLRATVKDIETIEAEVVFLVRAAGQWPSHQTEIHFHPSNAEHRAVAEAIVRACTGHQPFPSGYQAGDVMRNAGAAPSV